MRVYLIHLSSPILWSFCAFGTLSAAEPPVAPAAGTAKPVLPKGPLLAKAPEFASCGAFASDAMKARAARVYQRDFAIH